MLERIYALSPRARLTEGDEGFALVCTYPLQRVALNSTGYQVLRTLDGETPLHALVDPVSAELVEFLESLVTQGCLMSDYRASPYAFAPRIEVVIPVFNNPEGLLRCLAGLAESAYPRERWCITIVDDGSAHPQEAVVEELPEGLPRLRWIRLESNQGPASARNAALQAPPDPVGGFVPPAELIAFVDSDCVPGPRWLTELAGALEDPLLSAVGGQVLGLRQDTWLARYEDACASLNLGSSGGFAGGSRDRIPYVPTCNLLIRRAALDAVRGFTPGLRVGEDVDLVWRLRTLGLRTFYLPASQPETAVYHAYRDRPRPFCTRKAEYAASEIWLRSVHRARFLSRGGGTVTYAPDLALVLIACGAEVGSALAGVIAGFLALFGESIGHGVAHTATFRRAGAGVLGVLLALIRRSAAHILVRCRAIVRNHAVLGLAALPYGLWEATDEHPGLLIELLAIWLAAALSEVLARRPTLTGWSAGPVFLAGYTLEVLAYSFGRWRAQLAGWITDCLKWKARTSAWIEALRLRVQSR